jgi:pimeloyl-ACP methyl ester carboxylesterase
MIPLIILLSLILLLYLAATLLVTYLIHQIPRKPVVDKPDWGKVTDFRIPVCNGKSLEVWKIEPDGKSRGIVLLIHGWSRNRDRMTHRGRFFGKWGYTVIIPSVRDHGNSSPQIGMNALRFSEDIQSIMDWIGEPVILYGHSAGSGGAAIAAWKQPEMVKLLFLEGSYPYTDEMLLSLFRYHGRWFYFFFGKAVLFWMNLFYRGKLDRLSPAVLAPDLKMPVMVIHGEKDQRFPVSFAFAIKDKLKKDLSEIYIAPGARHSEASHTPGYAGAVKAFLDRFSKV